MIATLRLLPSLWLPAHKDAFEYPDNAARQAYVELTEHLSNELANPLPLLARVIAREKQLNKGQLLLHHNNFNNVR